VPYRVAWVMAETGRAGQLVSSAGLNSRPSGTAVPAGRDRAAAREAQYPVAAQAPQHLYREILQQERQPHHVIPGVE
jgi:hypothetical protein